MKKNLLKKISIVIIFFVAINIGVFCYLAGTYAIGHPYKKAKVYMAGAVMTNMLYVIPLQKIFGYQNALAKPAIKVRDYFYDNGIKNIPATDGEREIWWYRIKLVEIISTMVDISIECTKESYRGHITPEYILKQYDSMYEHILPMASLYIKDNEWSEYRLVALSRTIMEYVVGKSGVYNNYKDWDDADFYLYDNATFNDKNEINKIEKLLVLYQKIVKNYPKKYFDNYPSYYKFAIPYIFYELSTPILASKIISKKFNCEDKVTRIFIQSYFGMEKFLNNPTIPKKQKEFPLRYSLYENETTQRIFQHISTNCK